MARSLTDSKGFSIGSLQGYATKLAGRNQLQLVDPTASFLGTDDAVMSATFVISTGKQDRDGDIVIPKGCILDGYKKNPVIFLNHQQHPIPIGKAMGPDGRLSVSIQSDRILATCYFDQADPDSVYIYGKVKRGFLNATSIGFFPLEAERLPEKKGRRNGETVGQQWQGWLFKRWELLEFSIVGVPSNPEALMLDDLDGAKISQKLRKALQPFVPVKAATGLGTAVPSEGGVLVQPEQKERGTDIQAVILPRTRYPEWEDAVRWLRAHGRSADKLTETNDAWTVEQFPESECQLETAREEPLVDGVVARVCQRKIEPEGGPVSDAKAYDDSDSEDTGDDAEATEQQMPLGAQCLMELAAHIQGKLPMLEPGIAVRKLYERILPMLAAAAAKDYPDLDLGIEMAEDKGDEEDEEDEESKEKSVYRVEVPAEDCTGPTVSVDWSPVMKEMATLRRELRIATGRID
jgi:hypothetical protein